MAVTLPPNRLQRAEQYCVNYAVVLPGAVTLDEAMKPEYWAHVGKVLKQHDTVRLIPEDGSYFAEALVLSSGAGFAKLKLLRHEALDEQDEPGSDAGDLYAKWGGPHDKWTVVRKSDGEKMKTTLASRGDAEKWLADHVAALSR